MKLSLRFVLPLTLVLAVFAWSIVPLVDRLTLRWFVRDMDIRSVLIVNTIGESLLEQIAAGSKVKTLNFFDRITQDERLYAVGYCATPESAPLASKLLPVDIRCDNLARFETIGGHVLKSARGLFHVTVKSMESGGMAAGKLVLVHDMNFIERRSEETRRYVFLFFVGLAIVVSLITVIIAQLSWRGWVEGIRALLRGEGLVRQPEVKFVRPEFQPIARDLQQLIHRFQP